MLDKYIHSYRALELVRAVELDPLGYQLRLWHVETELDFGTRWREKLAYRLSDKTGAVIFEGADFGCSPLHAIDSDDAVITILSFLTLRRGDTDADYFSNYTPAQLEWSESDDAQRISLFVYDFENPPEDVEDFELDIRLLDID